MWISPIRLAASDLNFLIVFFVQYKTFMLAHQKTEFLITWLRKTFGTTFHKSNPNVALGSSNRGVLCVFSSATLELETMKETDKDPS